VCVVVVLLLPSPLDMNTITKELHPQRLKQFLGHNKCSVSDCWMTTECWKGFLGVGILLNLALKEECVRKKEGPGHE
jgi:hypothetical protein